MRIDRETMDCPVCSKATEKIKVGVWNEYQLFRCAQCDVVFSYPFVAGDESWYVDSGNYELLRFNTKTDWQHEQFLSAPPKGKKLLDIGCNNGVFLHCAEKIGFEVAGLDFNSNSLDAGRKAFGLKRLYCLTLDDYAKQYPEEKFDIITFFEVLEHLDNPNEFIEKAKYLLKPTGYIALSVPNRDMFINPLGDEDYPPHHLTRWSKKSLNNILNAHSFTVVSYKAKKVRPEDFAGWFDYHVIKKIDHRIRKRLKKAAGNALESKWQRGDIEAVPLAYRLRQWEIKLLSLLFYPLAVFPMLKGSKGVQQYILAKIEKSKSSIPNIA